MDSTAHSNNTTSSGPGADDAVSDEIRRSTLIDATRDRVWNALANAEAFGAWFGANLNGQTFAPGVRARGPITFPGYEHFWFDVLVERVEPQKVLSYRWHPYAVDRAVDYDKEIPTLVTFTLADAPGNRTLLTVVESGFDNVPPQRRLEAFRMNTRGWETQMEKLSRHVSG